MYLSGSLDCEQLLTPLEKHVSLESSGVHLDDCSRVKIYIKSGEYRLEIGNLVESEDSHPLATIIRSKNRFLLSIPSYSFLSLYFIQHENILYWSTHLETLRKNNTTKTNTGNLEKFGLKYQIWPDGETIFAQVKKLSPGHQLIIDVDGQAITNHHEPIVSIPQIDPEDKAAVQEIIYNSLIEAVDQLSTENELNGVMLGGFDSALIISLLAELGRPTHAVTLGYSNKKYNQPHISSLIKRFGFSHDWVNVQPELIRQGLVEYKNFFNQPVTQPHYLISSLHLGRTLAERGATLALTGDGCDGAFFGYPTVFKKAKLIRTMQQTPEFIKKPLQWFLGTYTAEKLIGQPTRLARQLLELTNRPVHLQNFLTAIAVDNISAQRAMGKPGLDPDFETEKLESLFQNVTIDKDWIDITYIGKNMVGLNREKLASIWNHSGLKKVFSPYMMPEVTTIAKAIPKHYWINKETPSGKYLLACMAIERGLLNKEIVYQKKMSPVASPTDHWFRQELKNDILKILDHNSNLDSKYCRELLRKRKLEEWFKEHFTIDDYTSQTLGMFLSYSLMTTTSNENQ